MATLYQSLLDKLTGWKKRLVARDGSGKLSEVMQTYLAKQFKLLPEDIADLRYVRRLDGFARVYNVAEVRENSVVVNKFHDLDRHPELVVFYGHLNGNKVRYLKKNVK